MGLRGEERRMKRAIGALVVALAPLAAVEACSTSSTPSVHGTSALDAYTQSTTDDSATDSPEILDGTIPPDANPANCAASITVLDAALNPDADADPPCEYFLPCGFTGVNRVQGCQAVAISSNGGAPIPLGCWVVQEGCEEDAYSPDSSVTIYCPDCIGGGGRRPDGLLREGDWTAKKNSVARYFGELAFEEEAAILAFERMRIELTENGAPRSLTRAARRAIRDEREHATTFDALAHRSQGGLSESPTSSSGRATSSGVSESANPSRVRASSSGVHVSANPSGVRARLPRFRKRSLCAIAAENAAEGCVREAFGAALLAYQAKYARDLELRATLLRISADEARHAALSFALAAWADPKLTPRERARVKAARTRALLTLRSDVAQRVARDYDADVGHPTTRDALALLDGIAAALSLG